MVAQLADILIHVAATSPAIPVLIALIIFLSPLLVLRLLYSAPAPHMVFESLGLAALFGWASARGDGESSSEKRKLKKKMRAGLAAGARTTMLNTVRVCFHERAWL